MLVGSTFGSIEKGTASLRAANAVGGTVARRTTAMTTKREASFLQYSISRTEFDYLWNVMGLGSFYIERLNGLAKNRYIKCELDDKLRDLHGIVK